MAADNGLGSLYTLNSVKQISEENNVRVVEGRIVQPAAHKYHDQSPVGICFTRYVIEDRVQLVTVVKFALVAQFDVID